MTKGMSQTTVWTTVSVRETARDKVNAKKGCGRYPTLTCPRVENPGKAALCQEEAKQSWVWRYLSPKLDWRSGHECLSGSSERCEVRAKGRPPLDKLKPIGLSRDA